MRAQSHVVGAALMLGLGVVALGALTMGVGTVLESQASSADVDRVGTTMDEALSGVDQTGTHTQTVSFGEGQLRTADRQIRVLRNGSVIQNHSADALVFERDNRRVVGLSGAVVRGTPGNAWLVADPPITQSEQTGVIVVGTPVLGGEEVTTSGQGGVQATLITDVSHTEHDLGTGEFSVAIETKTPEPFERFFESQNATTERQQFAGDSYESVVGEYPAIRSGYQVIHNLSLEVRHG